MADGVVKCTATHGCDFVFKPFGVEGETTRVVGRKRKENVKVELDKKIVLTRKKRGRVVERLMGLFGENMSGETKLETSENIGRDRERVTGKEEDGVLGLRSEENTGKVAVERTAEDGSNRGRGTGEKRWKDEGNVLGLCGEEISGRPAVEGRLDGDSSRGCVRGGDLEKNGVRGQCMLRGMTALGEKGVEADFEELRSVDSGYGCSKDEVNERWLSERRSTYVDCTSEADRRRVSDGKPARTCNAGDRGDGDGYWSVDKDSCSGSDTSVRDWLKRELSSSEETRVKKDENDDEFTSGEDGCQKNDGKEEESARVCNAGNGGVEPWSHGGCSAGGYDVDDAYSADISRLANRIATPKKMLILEECVGKVEGRDEGRKRFAGSRAQCEEMSSRELRLEGWEAELESRWVAMTDREDRLKRKEMQFEEWSEQRMYRMKEEEENIKMGLEEWKRMKVQESNLEQKEEVMRGKEARLQQRVVKFKQEKKICEEKLRARHEALVNAEEWLNTVKGRIEKLEALLVDNEPCRRGLIGRELIVQEEEDGIKGVERVLSEHNGTGKKKCRKMGQSSQTMSRVSTEDMTKVQRRARPVREKSPLKFDGTGRWKDFYLHFTACKLYNMWTDEEAALQLFTCCNGEALSALSANEMDPGKVAYQELVGWMSKVFGPKECVERYFEELLGRELEAGESLCSLGHDIRRLVALVHPEVGREGREVMAVQHFARAIGQIELRDEIRRAKVETVDDAINCAQRMMSYLHAEEMRAQRLQNPANDESGTEAQVLGRDERLVDEVEQGTLTDGTVLKQPMPPCYASGARRRVKRMRLPNRNSGRVGTVKWNDEVELRSDDKVTLRRGADRRHGAQSSQRVGEYSSGTRPMNFARSDHVECAGGYGDSGDAPCEANVPTVAIVPSERMVQENVVKGDVHNMDKKRRGTQVPRVEEDETNVEEGLIFTKIREEQLKDEALCDILRLKETSSGGPLDESKVKSLKLSGEARMYFRQWGLLDVKEGVLVRRWESGDGRRIKWLIVLPESLRTQVIPEECRKSSLGAKNVLRDAYYWIGMDEDIQACLHGYVPEIKSCSESDEWPTFEQGQFVQMRSAKENVFGDYDWQGPYQVVEVVSDDLLRIQRSKNSLPRVVQAGRLRLFEGRKPKPWKYERPQVLKEDGPMLNVQDKCFLVRDRRGESGTSAAVASDLRGKCNQNAGKVQASGGGESCN